MQYYCEVPGCWCTYPCGIHPKPTFELKIPKGEIDPLRKRFDLITEVTYIPLPCSHHWVMPEDVKIPKHGARKFNTHCPVCNVKYEIELKSDVVEMTRL